MQTHTLNYPVCLKFDGRQYFLLWQDGQEQRDCYVLRPNSSDLLLADTSKALFDSAAKLNLQVAAEEIFTIDMDDVFKALDSLREGRAASERTCQLLLDGWNALEDMAWSIRPSLDEHEDREMLNVIYDKLFYGNNLPAVTPSNRSYSPVFSMAEKNTVHRYLTSLWKMIFNPCKA